MSEYIYVFCVLLLATAAAFVHPDVFSNACYSVIDLLIKNPSGKLKERLKTLETQQKEAELELEKLENSAITEEKLGRYIVKIKDFEKLSREQKQLFINRLIKKITAYKDGNLEIETTYSDVISNIGGATQI